MKRHVLIIAASMLVSTASALTVEVQVFRHSYCGRQSGYAVAFVSGGVPPYTYAWSDGSSDMHALGLFPGNYSLTVTDSQSDQATASFTIDLLPSYGVISYPTSLPRCAGDPALVPVYTGMEAWFQQPPPTGNYGTNPYYFNHPQLVANQQSTECQAPQNLLYEVLQFSGPAPANHTVDFTDSDGCPGQVEVYITPELTALPQVQAVSVYPSCANTPTGSITFAYEGFEDYSYLVVIRPDAVAGECEPQVSIEWVGASSIGGTRTVTNLLPGDYWMITSMDPQRLLSGTPWSQYACKDSVLVTVPSLGSGCGVLSGRLYIDEDADCLMGSAGTENRVPGAIVEITPGPIYLTTNNSGQYSIGLSFGDYTVTEQHPVFDQSCPASVTLSSNSQTLNIGSAGGEPLDVQLAMANGPARPGFSFQYAIDLDNLTPAATGAVTLTLTLDPALNFLVAYPTPSSVVGNVLTWTSPQLVMSQVFEHDDINVHVQVPSDVGLIGSTLTTTAQLSTANTDGNLANNTTTSNQVVTGSFDPNDKQASTSLGSNSVWLINEDAWIDYTIRFQNTGTDTAFNVVITDTLPPTLDPARITWGAASHAHTRALEGSGVLKFIFPNILLPDSNVNEAASHGFVSFRIRPHLPIAPGTAIENIANIYFDFNPPVITEPSVLTAEFSTGTQEQAQGQEAVRLQPNPVDAELHIGAVNSIGTVRIIAADGREVLWRALRASNATIDVSGLKAGAYLLIALTREGNTMQQRFIKTDRP